MYRTHTCGELRGENDGQKVVLAGWVSRVRDLGGLIFVEMRDRYGRTQVVFDPSIDESRATQAKKLRQEWVVRIEGDVQRRPDGMTNPDMPTGEIDVHGTLIEEIATCETPPLLPEDDFEPSEEHRLRFRFLDLRRDRMQNNLRARHELLQKVRRIADMRISRKTMSNQCFACR